MKNKKNVCVNLDFIALVNLDGAIENLQKAINNLEGSRLSNKGEQGKVDKVIQIIDDVKSALNNLDSYQTFLEKQGFDNGEFQETSCLMCNYLDIDKIFKCCQLSEEELLKERWEGKHKIRCSAYE